MLGRRKGSYTKLQTLIDARSQIVQELNAGRSITSICRKYGVARDTFSRFRSKYLYTVQRGKFARYRVNGNSAGLRRESSQE